MAPLTTDVAVRTCIGWPSPLHFRPNTWAGWPTCPYVRVRSQSVDFSICLAQSIFPFISPALFLADYAIFALPLGFLYQIYNELIPWHIFHRTRFWMDKECGAFTCSTRYGIWFLYRVARRKIPLNENSYLLETSFISAKWRTIQNRQTQCVL